MVELLAPGGSFESVKAAINAGADAVYTGGAMFGAREYADNLNTEQMIEVLDYAHIHGRKIYLTVNTLLKDIEIEKSLYDYLLPFYENGLDAVIVQDLGVMKFIRERFPDLPIHASTQMTIMGDKTAKYLKEYGVTRIVTPREMNLPEIKGIYDNTQMEIESFVHGALCYCYSGQCFLSSYIGGRSGNRGKCAQPCRLNYDVLQNGKVLNPGDNKYVLSPKDICTLNILPDIIEAGVCSLKIEGRMKKTEYTAGITALYRKYIDLYLEKGRAGYKVLPQDIQKAMDLFNRNGFSESYYKIHNSKDMISLKKPSFRMENEDLVKTIRDKYINVEPREEIDLYITIINDTEVNVIATYNDICIQVSGDVPQMAQKAPLTADTVTKQMSKLGNTPFEARHIEVNLEDGLFLTMGQLNALRREMVDSLTEQIVNQSKRTISKIDYTCHDSTIIDSYERQELEITALTTTKEQAMSIIEGNTVARIYVESYNVSTEDLMDIIACGKNGGTKIYLAMPHVFRKDNQELFENKFNNIISDFDGYLVRNIEEYFYLKGNGLDENIIFDYNAYTFNGYSKALVKELNPNIRTTVPVELNQKELQKRNCRGEEIVIYGYMPVMITANCVGKTCDSCKKDNGRYNLRDRMSQIMNVQCVCDYCYNIIYNTKALSLMKYAKEIIDLNVSSLRLEFTTESRRETEVILDKFNNMFKYGSNNVEDINDSTRGHFNRGVK